MEKLVSIILPTYNGSQRIEMALESVLAQKYSNWELLVLDDGSQDNTASIVDIFVKKDARIKYIKNEVNLGIQKTLNKGLKEAKGEYIARIDDDDVWCDQNKLNEQILFLEKNTEYVLVGTGVIIVDENNRELFRYLLPQTDSEIRKNILSKNCFIHSSVLFKKDKVMQIGGYDESINTRHVEDYDLWLRLGLNGKFANIPSYAVMFKLHNASISAQNKIEQYKKIFKVIKTFKNQYPKYFKAYIRSIARLVVYGFFAKLPISFSFNKMYKLYQKYW
ncbi:MAG: glycosyltransferase [Patescibacteria group bacterium]